MKAPWLLMIALACLTGVSRASGQLIVTNTDGAVVTNKIGRAEAIAVASHLTKGMREEDAESFLKQHGLGWSFSFGDSFGWCTVFPLTNGGALCLDIKPKAFRADGEWRDGLLQAASIQSKGSNIVSIKLVNAVSPTESSDGEHHGN